MFAERIERILPNFKFMKLKLQYKRNIQYLTPTFHFDSLGQRTSNTDTKIIVLRHLEYLNSFQI